MNLNIEDLKNEWYKLEAEKISNEDPKANKRKYIHFDFRPSNFNTDYVAFAWKPYVVSRHSFYPFISNSIIQRRRKNTDGGVRILSKKERPISYASHKDSLLFSWYSYYLTRLYEEKIKTLNINNSIIAYRSLSKSSIDFAKEVFDFVREQKKCVVLCFDITGFFDNLNHSIIKNQWKNLLNINKDDELPPDHYAVYKAITKYSSVELEDVKKIFISSKGRLCSPKELREKLSKKGLIKKNIKPFGIPQGSPISAGISNFYMIDFDIAVSGYVNTVGGLYKRYCDDIIAVIPFSDTDNFKDISNKSESFIKNEITNQKLEIQDKKTDKKIFIAKDNKLNCLNFELKKSSVQYLGIIFDGINLDLRGSTWARYQRKLSKFVALKTHRFIRHGNKIFPKKQIYERFTDFGDNNIIHYAKNAQTILNSQLIKRKITKNNLIKNIKKKITTEITKQQKKQNRSS